MAKNPNIEALAQNPCVGAIHQSLKELDGIRMRRADLVPRMVAAANQADIVSDLMLVH